MVKSAGGAEGTETGAENQITTTFGEVFRDGCITDVVASATDDQLNLLFWNGRSTLIARQVEYGGRTYRMQKLHASIVQATRLPRESVGYGTVQKLFTELRGKFETYLGFSPRSAELSTFWVLTTWFCDCFSSPPTLWISGADVDLAAGFLGLLHCLCRRALRVSGVTRAGFLALPLDFRPTVLVNQPTLSLGLKNLWCESNSRGSVVPGNRGVVLDVTTSKAVFLGMFGLAPPPGAGNLQLTLFPPDHEMPSLDELVLNEIADYFQPRLLQYRLDHAKQVSESRFAAPSLRFPTRELARTLGACIQGDTDLALQVVPLLRSQDAIVDRCSLDFAIVEVLWPRVHKATGETAAASMKIGVDLTPEVNTYLLCCGETRQYSREAIGIRVAKLELTRKNTNAGTQLLLDRRTTYRVHQLARAYGIDKSVPGCPDCQSVEASSE
jgi:hypothetical protein